MLGTLGADQCRKKMALMPVLKPRSAQMFKKKVFFKFLINEFYPLENSQRSKVIVESERKERRALDQPPPPAGNQAAFPPGAAHGVHLTD